jgi:1-acyl-sn-glycerol-3-phosphate acyltransferase
MEFFYDFMGYVGTVTGFPAQWIYFTRKVYYEDRKDQGRYIKGGALVISNHYNPLDYVSNAGLLFPRKLDVVASEDAFRNKLQAFGMKFWGGIKCDRRVKSMRFIPESVKRIQRGRIVQIFPEGHNTPDGTIKEFYGSYILIALRANCPIIPIVSDGNYGLFKRLHVIIGKKIWLRDYLDHEKYTKEDILRLNDMVRNHVLELRQELDRRVEADRRRKKGER